MMNPSPLRARALVGIVLSTFGVIACATDAQEEDSPTADVHSAAEALQAAIGTITGISGKCLDHSGTGTSDGNKVQIWSCNGGAAQKWTHDADGALVGPGGKCLDVAGGSNANNTAVRLWTCNGTNAQKWSFTGGQMKSALGGCLNVKNASSTDGTAVELYACVASAPSEAWTYNGNSTTDPVPPPGGGTGTGDCSGASTAVDGITDGAHPSGKAPPTCTPKGYKIAYIDDFNGTALNSGWTLPSGFIATSVSTTSSWVARARPT